MNRKSVLKVSIVVLATALLIIPISIAAASGQQQTAPDCRASEVFGQMPSLASREINFTCSSAQQVYFGVCDPEFGFLTYRIDYEGATIASNDFDFNGEFSVQQANIGRAEANSGVNVASLISTNPNEGDVLYSYAISPDWGEVTTFVSSQCGASINSLNAFGERVLFEERFTGISGDGTLSTQGVIMELYDQVIFRADWQGSSGSLTVIPPSGEPIQQGDPGTEHHSTETSDELIVDNPPTGEYTVQLDYQDFDNETVVIGAYVTGPGLAPGETAGSIRGTVFDDANGNGIRDQGESGVAGVSIMISSAGPWQETFVTGDDGTYAPVALGRSYYSAEISVPAGYVASGPTRYEGIGIGYTGRLALGIDFAITKAALPAALPATGAGPDGAVSYLPLIVMLSLVGLFALWRGKLALNER